jgi:hypothetical protein
VNGRVRLLSAGFILIASACGCAALYTSTTHTPVVTRIHPGGHVYPPWAPMSIVEFFKNHKRP